jgi:hypothetical protein
LSTLRCTMLPHALSISPDSWLASSDSFVMPQSCSV